MYSTIAARPDFTVAEVTCDGDHPRESPPEYREDHRMVLVRRGRFRRRVDGTTADVDPTLAYLGLPGEEERFAHPAGGDTCTSVTIAPRLWRELTGGAERVARPTVYVDARLDLAHRRMIAAARTGDIAYAVTEELIRLLETTISQVVAGTPPPHRSRDRDRALATAARDLIGECHPAATELRPLADLLGASPYRLSRVFSREMGVSLTHYRNRVRVAQALDRLEGGEPSLARLAADLGFADQAHLTRTVRTHLGHTPAALRRLLAVF